MSLDSFNSEIIDQDTQSNFTHNNTRSSAQHVCHTAQTRHGSLQSDALSKGKARQLDPVRDDTEESVIIRITDAETQDDPEVQNTNDVHTEEAEPRAFMTELAPELLICVFSFLDPVSLSRSAAVCRSWALVARDDATWRSAFAVYFSLEAASANVQAAQTATTPALRRLVGSSWRHEFQQRVTLLRTWRKSRTPTVLSMPRVDIISKISLSKQHKFLLSTSDAYGVASRSNPWTGKVVKGYLDAEGTANGAGNGNPNVEFSPNVTCLNASADATSIFWGFRTGEIGITSLARQGINPRGAIKSHRFSPRACHAGPVTAIAIPFASDSDGAHGSGRSPERLRQAIAALGDVATTFVTAGFDGTVRLWSSLRPWPLWIAATSSLTPTSNAMASQTSTQQANAQSAAPICALAYDAKHGVVVAGTTTGKVFVWARIDVASLLQIPPEATDPEHARDGVIEPEIVEAQATFQRLGNNISTFAIDIPKGTGTEIAIASIAIDAAADEIKLLVHHSGAKVLLRHHITYSERSVETTLLGAAIMDEITAVRADFEPRVPKKETRSPGAQTPSASVYSSPASAAARDPSSDDVPRLVLGPSPFDTYSGSGKYPERKFVCVGTKSGSIFLFDWDAPGAPSDQTAQEEWQGHVPARFQGSTQLLPSLGWEAHHTPITALDMTPLYILVGTSDGTIKVFDALAGDLVRTINDRTATKHPARMLAAGEMTALEAARFRVTQIIADNDCLVASIGHQILAFRAEPVLSKRAAAAATAAASGKSKGGRNRLSDNKYALQVELKRDLRESKVQLEAENEQRQVEYDKYRSRGQDISRPGYQLEGLSEAEALEYALMLSRDEEAAQATHKAQHMGGSGYVPGSHASSSAARIEPTTVQHSIGDPDLADALEQIALAESKAEAEAHAASSHYHQAFESPTPFYTSATSLGKGKKARLLEDDDFDADLLDSDLYLDYDYDAHSQSQSQSQSNSNSCPEASGSPSPLPSPTTSPLLTATTGSGGATAPGRAFSPSPSSSLSTSASRAWTILAQAGGSASSPARSMDRWGQHSKVRTVHVPVSARISSPPLTPSLPLDSPLAAGGDRLGLPELGSPSDFPAMTPLSLSPHAASPSLAALAHVSSSSSSSTPLSRRASQTTEASTPSRLGKWNKSPVLHPTITPARTPTAWQLRSPPHNSSSPSGLSTSTVAGDPIAAPKTSLLAAALRPPAPSAHNSAVHVHPTPAPSQSDTNVDPEERDLLLAIQRSLADQHNQPPHPS